MRSALVGLVASLVVACGAFSGTEEPAPAADAGPPSPDAAPDAAGADASRPAVSVACENVGPCEGSHTACCSSGITGSTNTCDAPGKCPQGMPYAWLCDDPSDCLGAGFPAGTLCCAALRGDGIVMLGSTCVQATSCPGTDLELCQPSSPATSACTKGSCQTNTTKTPKVYAYCQ